MKTNLVSVAYCAVLTLTACGGTSHDPLKNYPKSEQLAPRDPSISTPTVPTEYVTKTEQKIVEVPKYVDRKVEVKVPTYIDRPVGRIDFFSVVAPDQMQFPVGAATSIPIRIKGLVGQLKYEVAVQSTSLKNMKLENVKVDGNDTTADLTFTAAASDIPAGNLIATGTINFNMTILEVKDANASLEKIYQDEVQSSAVRVVRNPYIVVPAGTAVQTPPVPEAAKPAAAGQSGVTP